MKINFMEAVQIISGGTPSTKNPLYWGGSIPWLSVVDFGSVNKYVFATEKHITDDGLHNSATKMLHQNDIIISARGTVGAMAMLGKPMAFNQSCFGLRGKPEIINQDFLFYYLRFYMKNITQKAQGSVFSTINLDTFKSIELDIPSIQNQKAIARILSNIDRKIDNNNTINAELEAMAKTIYDYWFLQFEFPNENGKPYKSSGGKMVYNEELKREIPEGWKVSDLSNVIEVIRGVAYDVQDISPNEIDGYVPLVKSNNIQSDQLILDDIIYVNKNNVSDEQILTKNSVFVTMSSGSTEHVGKTATIYYDMPYCYGAFCSKININPLYRCFVSLFFSSEYFKKKIRTIVVGTSIKNINNSHLINNLIAFPPMDILLKFETMVAPFFDKQGAIIQENQELASLRDFLLPLLMNGQVGFKEEA